MKRLSTPLLAACCAAVSFLTVSCGERSGSNQAAPAQAKAQAGPTVQLNMASMFPTSLTLIGEAAPKFVEKVRRASGGTLELKVYEPGALVPGLQTIFDAVKGVVFRIFVGGTLENPKVSPLTKSLEAERKGEDAASKLPQPSRTRVGE